MSWMKMRSISNGWFVVMSLLFVMALISNTIMIILLRSPETQPIAPTTNSNNTIEFDTLIGNTITRETCYELVEKLIKMEDDPVSLLKIINEYYLDHVINECERIDNYYIHCQESHILPVDITWLQNSEKRIMMHLHPDDSAAAMGLLASTGDREALRWLWERRRLPEYEYIDYWIVNNMEGSCLQKDWDNDSLPADTSGLIFDEASGKWYPVSDDK